MIKEVKFTKHEPLSHQKIYWKGAASRYVYQIKDSEARSVKSEEEMNCVTTLSENVPNQKSPDLAAEDMI